MKLQKIGLALIIGSALMTTAASVNAKTYRLATNATQNSTTGVLLSEFAENVADQTNDRVKIKIFWNGTLGNQNEYLRQMQDGVVDMGMINSGTLETLSPALGVMNLPYIFRSKDEYAQTLSDPRVGEAIDSYVSDSGLQQLGYLSNGFRSIYTTKPINTFEDLKGIKLRCISSESYITMMKHFGVVPTPLPLSDVYSAMEQGIVDGAEGGLAGLWEMKLGEVAKYALQDEHTRLTDFVLASQKFTAKLDPKDLAIVKGEFSRISEKSLDYIDIEMDKNTQKAVENLGVKVTTIDKAPFIEAVTPMYKAAMEDSEKKDFITTIFAVQKREL